MDPNAMPPPEAMYTPPPPDMGPPSSVPLMGNAYGQPIAVPPGPPQMPNTIVINQQSPAMMIHPNMFKTTPVSLNCTFCKKPITTTVTQTFNCCACCLCWCTGLLLYVCIQLCRGKDICCYDARHTCPYCGNVVGTYTAC